LIFIYMTKQISIAYNQIAEQWNTARKNGQFEPKYLDLMLGHLPCGAEVLDLGCGTGVPIARYLADRGYGVTGIDGSSAMLELARRQVPEANLILEDMLTFQSSAQYLGVIAWDSAFHILRSQHFSLFEKLHDWLLPDGILLISLGGSAWEGTTEMFGQEFLCSGFEPHDSVNLLEQVGFKILLSEVDDPSSRGHIAVLCQKGAE
jgi:cyclopropane fatty-acyl-phospholipid synthase-like methyltransferase